MKFERKKFDNLSGGTSVTYTDGEFELLATREGVLIKGHSPIIGNMDELQELAKVLSDAWSEHLRLKPRLMKAGEH